MWKVGSKLHFYYCGVICGTQCNKLKLQCLLMQLPPTYLIPLQSVPRGDWYCPDCRPKDLVRTPLKRRKSSLFDEETEEEEESEAESSDEESGNDDDDDDEDEDEASTADESESVEDSEEDDDTDDR